MRWIIAFCALCSLAHAQTFSLQKNERLVFYGDSITAQRLFTDYIEVYCVTRFPHLNIRFKNAGWGGDTVAGGRGGDIDTRLSRDLLSFRPTRAVVMLGMNDGGYKTFDKTLFDKFTTGYEHILSSISDVRSNVVLLPTPVDEITRKPAFPTGYTDVLDRYCAAIRELCSERDLTPVDMGHPLKDVLKRALALDAKTAELIIPDKVHPATAGHLVMAAEILKSWAAPAIVSDVEIDMTTRKVVRSASSRVSLGEGLKWTQLDESIPLPIQLTDSATQLVLRLSDAIENINRQLLTVTGLSTGNYALRIDDNQLGILSSADLSRGINLALLQTPMWRQSLEVWALTQQRSLAAQIKMMQIEARISAAPSIAPILDGFDEYEATVIKEQYKRARPIRRNYELVPAPAKSRM